MEDVIKALSMEEKIRVQDMAELVAAPTSALAPK
jgi:hypothetical protein